MLLPNIVTNITTNQTYSTIQAAIDAASPGDSIEIGAGTYNEHVNVNKANLTLTGVGDVTIQGTFASDNPSLGAGDLHTWIQNVAGYNGSAGDGVTIAASSVHVSNVNIDGFLNAVRFAVDTAATVLTDIAITNSVVGIEKSTTANINGLTLTGGSITDGYMGIDFAKATGVGNELDGVARNVLIDSTHFTDLTQKGIYMETLTDSTITGVVMDNVGQYGGGQAFGANGRAGNAININLKAGTYDNIVIENFTLTDTGTSNKEGAAVADKNGAAIAITARDDGGTYGPSPGVVTDTITIRNGTISGNTATGIQVGEPGQHNADPDVHVSGVTINGALHDALHGDIGNETKSTLTFDGGAGADSIVTSQSSTGKIVFHGGAGDDNFTGHGETDTLAVDATLTVNSFQVVSGHWTVSGDGTDTLSGTEKVTDGAGHTFLLVGAGGYASVQAAINAAGAGDFILVAPGTYTETATAPGGPAGLYINTAGLTIQGFSDATGLAVSSAQDAKDHGPTIISGAETNFGANFWIDSGGDHVTLTGLHLEAGNTTTNKLVEIWGDNATLTHNFVDVYTTGGDYTFAAALYVNDNGTEASDDITHLTVDGNILNEGVILANGAGNGTSGTISPDIAVTNNVFEGHFDTGTGEGRYDTLVINGQVAGIGWLLESTQSPTFTGNTLGDNSTPFILRGSDNNESHLPSAAQVADYLANNTDADTTYAYALKNDGALDTALRNDGSGDYHSFAVTNSIDTMNLALDTTGDAVFGSTPRQYMHSGDTLVVQSGSGAVDSAIMVDDLHVRATASSADLNLTLATTHADGSAIPGGVHTVTLDDYAAGQGANVDVTGNALDNTITGNSGDNVIDGGAGADTLSGGGGNDTLIGDTGTDTAAYNVALSVGDFSYDSGTDTWTVNAGTEGTDQLTGMEKVSATNGHFLLVDPNGSYTSIQAAIDAASAGDTIIVAAGTYNETVTVDKAVTIVGANHGIDGTGARGAESVVNGQITVTAASGSVMIDGLYVQNSSSNAVHQDGIAVTGAADVTVENSIIHSTGPNGSTAVSTWGDTALYVGTGATGHITLDNTLIDGAGTNSFANASWARGVVTETDASVLTITDNHMTGLRTGLGLAGLSSTDHITGNTFTNDGSGISAGLPLDFTHVTGNTFSGTGDEFNLRTATSGVTFDASTQTFTDGGPDLHVRILGGNDSDTLTGTSGDDYIAGDASTNSDGINFGAGSLINDANTIDGKGGNDVLLGSTGNDTFTGGTGTDSIAGGGGIDTAHFADTLAIGDFAYDAANHVWNVTTASEGTDSLANVEKATDGTHTFLLVDPNGDSGFTSLQAAINAAQAGDTIIVAAGTFTGNVTVDKALTIVGANHGIDGTAARGAESVVNGQITVTATSGDVHIDGLKVQNASSNSVHQDGIAVTGAANVTVENSVLWSTGPNGNFAAGPWGDVAVYVGTGATGHITLDDNLISGAGTDSFSNGSWARAVVTETDATTLTITGNTVNGLRSGIGAAGLSGADSITGNTFTNNGTAFAAGLALDMSLVTDNTFAGNVDEFNLRTATGSVVFDASGQTYTDNGPDTFVRILGGNDADTLTGTDGKDYIAGDASTNSDGINYGAGSSINDGNTIDGKGGNDVLLGSTGNDGFTGGSGDDDIYGGPGSDTANFSGNWNAYTISEAAGVIIVTGPDGTDTLHDIENLHFANGTFSAADVLNDAPVAVDDANAVSGGAVTGNVLTNDTDADSSLGDTKTVTQAGIGTEGSATYNPVSGATVLTGTYGNLTINPDGSYSYALNDGAANVHALGAGQTATDTFAYQVSDSHAASDKAQLVITINGTNDNPTLTAAQAVLSSGTEDTAYVVSAASLLQGYTDVDSGDTLSVTGVSSNHGSVVDNHDGTYTVTPTANYNGPVTLSYTVADAHGGSVAATESFTLAAVNDLPVAGTDAATVLAGGPRTITLTTASLLANDTDADGNSLSITGVSVAGHGTVTFSNNGTAGDTSDDYVTYTPTTGYSGADSFNYILSDGTASTLGAVNVTVQAAASTYTNGTGGNDVIDKSSQSGVQLINGQGGNDTLTGGTAADTLNGGEGNDTLNGGPGADTLTGGNGADIFFIAKADMASGVDKITDFTGAGNGAVAGDDVIQLSGFNVGATVAKISDNGTAHTYRVTDGAFTGTFVAVYSGNATLTAGDYVFVNSVSPGNTAPVANTDTANVSQNGSVNISVASLLANDTDAESNPLTIIAVSGATHGTAVLNDNGTAGNTADDYVVFTPTSGYSGPASFSYTLSDSFTTSTGNVNVTVTAAPPNNLPVANNDAFATNEDTVLNGTTVLVNDSDADAQALTAQLVTGPAHGSLTLNANGTFTYTPFANYNGTDSFTYKDSDGIGTGNTATVNLTINPVNDAPVAGADAATVLVAGPRTIQLTTASLLANDTDADGNTLTITGVTAAAHGTVVFSDNGTAGNTADDYITYTPTSGYSGADSFTYLLSDGSTSVNGTVNVTVQAETGVPAYTSGTAGNDTYDFSARTGVQTVAGNGGNDVITGGSAGDTINGGADNDTINGGGGKDTLTGGTGQDTFVFTSADADKVVDFSVADDTIALSKATFSAVTEQNNVDHILTASQFVIGTAATTADQHVIYNAATGALYYDADGNGAGAMVQIALLTKNLTLTHDDFVVWA